MSSNLSKFKAVVKKYPEFLLLEDLFSDGNNREFFTFCEIIRVMEDISNLSDRLYYQEDRDIRNAIYTFNSVCLDLAGYINDVFKARYGFYCTYIISAARECAKMGE